MSIPWWLLANELENTHISTASPRASDLITPSIDKSDVEAVTRSLRVYQD